VGIRIPTPLVCFAVVKSINISKIMQNFIKNCLKKIDNSKKYSYNNKVKIIYRRKQVPFGLISCRGLSNIKV